MSAPGILSNSPTLRFLETKVGLSQQLQPNGEVMNLARLGFGEDVSHLINPLIPAPPNVLPVAPAVPPPGSLAQARHDYELLLTTYIPLRKEIRSLQLAEARFKLTLAAAYENCPMLKNHFGHDLNAQSVSAQVLFDTIKTYLVVEQRDHVQLEIELNKEFKLNTASTAPTVIVQTQASLVEMTNVWNYCANNGHVLDDARKFHQLNNRFLKQALFKDQAAHLLRTHANPTVAQTIEAIKTQARITDLTDWKSAFAVTSEYKAHAATEAIPPTEVTALTAAVKKDKRKAKSRTNDNTHYCWSHGPNKSHSPHTGQPDQVCKHKATGHIDAATLADKMGGRTEPWVGGAKVGV